MSDRWDGMDGYYRSLVLLEHLIPAPSTSSLSSMNKSERSARYVSALAKHYFDVLNTKAIDSGWLEPPRPKRKKSKKY